MRVSHSTGFDSEAPEARAATKGALRRRRRRTERATNTTPTIVINKAKTAEKTYMLRETGGKLLGPIESEAVELGDCEERLEPGEVGVAIKSRSRGMREGSSSHYRRIRVS